MAFYRGPNIVRNGLVLCLDAASRRSYPGSGTTWTDLSGLNNNGTLTNGPTFNSANGGSIVFDGTNDYVLVDSSTIIPGLTSFTLCVWLNYTIPGSDQFRDIINSRESSAPNKGFLLTTDSSSKTGKIRIQLNGTGTNSYTSTSGANIANGNNNFVVISVNRSANSAIAYVNGILDATFNITGIGDISSTEKFYIGWDKAFADTKAYFQGRIYSTIVYNRALSDKEILQNYNATKGRFRL